MPIVRTTELSDSDARPENFSVFAKLAAFRDRGATMDLFASYTASGVRIIAWAAVSAMVYRLAGADHFGTLALIRGTIGILTYTAVGLAPALVRVFAETGKGRLDLWQIAKSEALPGGPPPNEREIYSAGAMIALVSTSLGFLIASIYAGIFDRLHVVPTALRAQAPLAVLLLGAGTLLRLLSDVSGAALQTRGKIALDSYILAATDALWAIATLLLYHYAGVLTAASTYAFASVFLVAARSAAVARLSATPWPPTWKIVRRRVVGRILGFGSWVLLSQAAEYLYAAADYILINHFLGANDVAAYAPGVQIDGGLLTLSTALAAVLLPRAALAHIAGHTTTLRRYYVRGTLASAVLLASAATAVWLISPVIFRIWFGAHPPATRQILDLVLIGTVVGGSSAVGRSVLFGMGKMGPFTLAAIAAGLVNVIASYCFVKYLHLGLRGILWGTVIAVTARCAVWMPWYVFTRLGREEMAERNKNIATI